MTEQATWRVWAPNARQLRLHLDRRVRRFDRVANGFHSLRLPRLEHGTRYKLSIDGGDPVPDVWSRWQPDGVFGYSAVWYPERFRWTDQSWRGVPRQDLVLYEIHAGTFTPEGTLDAIVPRLQSLRELGVTALLLMPVAQFSGRWGWGYDGVFPFAVHNTYGGPDALCRLVDAAHREGLAVLLDVVYNHVGPEGSWFSKYGPYFHQDPIPWGDAYDFRSHQAVMSLLYQSASAWIRDFHLDGLRIDALHHIDDHQAIQLMVGAARYHRRTDHVHFIAEDDRNDLQLVIGELGLDAQYVDDFHHAVHTAVTNEARSLYVDFVPASASLSKAYEKVFVNNGTPSRFRGGPHGKKVDNPDGSRTVVCIQNHDFVGNRPAAERLATMVPECKLRLAAGLMLLAPRIPQLFMGEEYGETRPFHYFADFSDQALQRAVRDGRRSCVAHLGDEEPADPFSEETVRSSIPEWRTDGTLRDLYRGLLELRRREPDLRRLDPCKTMLLDKVLLVRRGELLLAFNLGGVYGTMPPGEVVWHSGEGYWMGPWQFAVIRCREPWRGI